MATATKPMERKGSVVVTFRLTGAKKEQVLFFPGRIPGGFRRKLSAVAETIQTQGTWIPEQVHIAPKAPISVSFEGTEQVYRHQPIPPFKAAQAAKLLEAKANQRQQLCNCPSTGIVFTVGMPDMGMTFPMPHPLSLIENVEGMIQSQHRKLEDLPLVVLAGALMTLLKSKKLMSWKNASWANATLERAGKEMLAKSLRFWLNRSSRGLAGIHLDQSNLAHNFHVKGALKNLMQRASGEDLSILPMKDIPNAKPELSTKQAIQRAKVHVDAKSEAKAIKSQSQNGKELFKVLKWRLPVGLRTRLAMALANLSVISKKALDSLASDLLSGLPDSQEAQALARILSNVQTQKLQDDLTDWAAEYEAEVKTETVAARDFNSILAAALAKSKGKA